MSLQKLISNYASFNQWANREMTDWLMTLDTKILKTEVPASFNTIQKTLQHINMAQMFWLDFISGKDVSNFKWDIAYKDPKDTILNLMEVSVKMQTAFSAFDESQLTEKLKLSKPWAKNNLSRYEYVMHVINHGTYHRGQIINMARSFGVKEGFPKTDLNIYSTIQESIIS